MRRNIGLSLLILALSGVALAVQAGTRAGDGERRYELVALDERAGRAVLMDVAGATEVLRVDEETRDGLRLKSVANGSVLLDVRFKSSGEVIGYRIALGETVSIRPLPEHRSGGVRVISAPLEAATPAVRTGDKEPPPPSARD